MRALVKNWSSVITVGDEGKVREFALGVGDHNSLHHDGGASAEAGESKGIIVPAATIIGLGASAIADEIPGVRVHKLEITFKRPVFPGMRLSIFCSLLKRRDPIANVEVIFRNEEMKMVAKGSCQLVLPK